jgi:hypothetical protein
MAPSDCVMTNFVSTPPGDAALPDRELVWKTSKLATSKVIELAEHSHCN